jgi:hypothetical protein
MSVLKFQNRKPVELVTMNAARMRVRVGEAVTNPPPATPPAAPAQSTAMKAAIYAGGANYPVETTAGTAAGALAGFFFFGPLGALVGGAAANLVGRYAGQAVCKSAPNDTSKCDQKVT